MKFDIDEEWKRFSVNFFSTFRTKPSPDAYNTVKRLYYTALLSGFKIGIQIMSSEMNIDEQAETLIDVQNQFRRFGKEYIL